MDRSPAIPPSPPRAWAEIDISALKHNLKLAIARSGCEAMAVLKAGAYGHGLEQIAKELDKEKLPFFGVANVGEARRLAHADVQTRPYLLGATFPDEREEIVGYEWTPCLSTIEEAQHFSSLAVLHGKKLRAHLAVDTGMGRGGFLPADCAAAVEAMMLLPGIELEGIGSHMPSPDEDREFTLRQIAEFTDLIDALKAKISVKYIHLSNSAGILGYEQFRSNLVRPGLMLYGISPLAEFQKELRPVMSLKSKITVIRELPTGHGVSYGRSFITQRPTKVATVGVGYGDGYERSLSGKNAEVWVNGERLPVIGRVTMDQIMVDVTDSKSATIGDEVELFGKNILASEIAQKAETIAWELFTGITPRVTRLYF